MATQCIQQTIHTLLTPIWYTANKSYTINSNMSTQFIHETIHLVLTPIWLYSVYSKQFIHY